MIPTGKALKPVVLLVDDDPLSRDAVREMLEANGLAVESASGGTEAVRAVARGGYSALITDMVMPDMNGTELIRNTRRLCPAMPIVVISGEATKATESRLRKAGVEAFLRKPVRMRALMKATASIMPADGPSSGRGLFTRVARMPEVLVADDNTDLLQALAMGLRAHDYAVTTARNGVQAWKRARSARFDAVVADINMPGLHGTALVREIRTKYPSVSIVLISGEADKTEIREAMEAGADSYLPKPFGIGVLVAEIEKVRENRGRIVSWVGTQSPAGRSTAGYRPARGLRALRGYPIVTTLILSLLGLVIVYWAATAERREEKMIDRVDALIEAVKGDWGR